MMIFLAHTTHKHRHYHQRIHVARHVAVAKFCFMEKGALDGDGYGASAGPSVSSVPAAPAALAAAAGPAPAPQHPPPFFPLKGISAATRRNRQIHDVRCMLCE